MIDFRAASLGRALRSGLLPGLFAGGAVAAALATLLGGLSAPTPVVHALALPAGLDADSDGLPDALEQRLGLDPNTADTDSDGVHDAEEIARHSLASDPGTLPGPDPVAINLVTYQDGGPVHLVTIMYSADGNLANKTLGMGARVGRVVRQAPVSFFTKNATFFSLQGKVFGSAIMVIDAPLDPTLLQRFGSMSFYSIISDTGTKVDAGVVELALKHDVVVQYVASGILASGLGRTAAPSSFYGPVDMNAVLEWTPGEICGQVTTVAATMGPVIVEEVIDAGCEPGWDSYCDSGCAATVGDTLQRIDPVALING